MKLTDFFSLCTDALKSAVLGSSEHKDQQPQQAITLTDEQALELFAEIRAMDISHKSERGNGAACNERAHAIYVILAERGIENVQKGWISSPLLSNGLPNYLIKSPVEILYALRDEDYDQNGQLRVKDDEPFNIHVAPVITTAEGRQLVFDTYFYDNPPELQQWRDDFKPYEEGVELDFQLTSPEYVYFNEIGSPLPEEGSLRQFTSRGRAHAQVMRDLKHLASNPVDRPLTAAWLSDSAIRVQLKDEPGADMGGIDEGPPVG